MEGDMYEKSCSSSPPPSREPDDISLFLHQILVRSSSSLSSSSSSSYVMSHHHESDQLRSLLPSRTGPENPCWSALVSGSNRVVGEGITAAESSSGVLAACFPAEVGASAGYELDEYDCESEEGLEAVVEEAPAKPVPSRASSKRSRAAEVHNLSEKRRRSRINEKMKALQNLIPNSNKTDKASMLDEAIEYLKQLQLQVQMLSMRNGLSLHPMCLPGVLHPIQLSPMRMGFGEGNASLHMNMTGTLTINQETAMQTMFSLPNHCTTSNQPSVTNMPAVINSETSFGLESSIQAHLRPFQLHMSSQEICREDMLPHQQLNVNHSETNPLAMASVSLPFESQPAELKDHDSLDACILGKDQPEGVLVKDTEHNRILSPNLNGMHGGRSGPNDNVKMERPDF